MRMSIRVVAVVACAAAVPLAGSGAASAQTTNASVTGVTDGDTLSVRASDGRDLTVRLIGIDAPEPDECGGSDARDALRELVDGHAIELESDPAIAPVDEFGRSRSYVDRADGLDVGLALVRQGWATVLDTPQFARLPQYLDAESESIGGAWADCGGDFHLTRAEQLRELRGSAKSFVRRYYRRLSNDQYRAAWGMLGTPVRRTLSFSFRNWRSGFRGSLGIAARATGARVSGSRVMVSVRLRSRDRDVCNGRAVAQRFRGTVTVAQRAGTFAVVRFQIHKTAGGTPRLSKSQCPPPPKPREPSPPVTDCQGYDPCIPPGPDVDCAGGSGNGPRYTGPVRVTGSDPYGLDSDNDGYGCED